jgi:hypothetical protein
MLEDVMPNQHHMRKVKTHPGGALEWKCDECGRHFVVQDQPFKRIILAKGDERVLHSGGALAANFDVSGNADTRQSERNVH